MIPQAAGLSRPNKMITVNGPDGVTLQFPDSMDGDAIGRVMARHFGSPEVKAKYEPITTGGLVSAALDVPVLGPLARKADAAIRAGAAPYINKTGIAEELPEASFGERYSHALSSLEAPLQKFEQEHPIAAGLANVAGTTAATLPLAATATGARLLGLGGRTLGGQMGAGALSGAGINAVDAALRGNDPGVAGIVGGVIGGVPAVARGVGAAVAPIASTVRGIVRIPVKLSTAISG
jgi:hypothetical protein